MKILLLLNKRNSLTACARYGQRNQNSYRIGRLSQDKKSKETVEEEDATP